MIQTPFVSPVIFGEVLFDCFPDGEEVLGGAPFNVAWHLQAFGAAPIFISRIGADSHGTTIAEAMTDWGMDSQGLQTDPLQPTGRVDITLNSEKEPCYEICHPVAYDNMASDALPNITKAGMLYHGCLALRSSETRRVFETLRSRISAPTFLDVNLRAPWWQREQVLNLIADADWIKLNQDELEALCTYRGSTRQRVRSWIEDFGLSGVVLTMGANGAKVITAEECLVASPPRVKSVVDPVGAGDGFASVFILGLLQNWDLTQTLVRAQEFAAAIVAQRGATSPDLHLYAHFISEWSEN